MNKYSASLIQEQFWLINKLQPDNPAYNVPSLFHMKGHLNIEALKNSLDKIIHRHEIFRTTFTQDGNQLYQIISDDTQLTFQLIQLKNKKENKENISHQIHQEITIPFDLENGPLFRATLFWLDDQEYILLFVMHHIITDLHCKALFSSELSVLYRADTLNTPLSRPSPPQYKEFALWQHNWIKEAQCNNMIDYWQHALKGHSGYLNLPTDHPRPPVLKMTGDAQPFRLSQHFTKALKQFSRAHNTNIFLTLLTTYFILLYRYTDQKDIITGVPLTNRRNSPHKNTAGCFVNILPIAIHVSGDQNFKEILQSLRQSMLGAHRNQELPYNLILKKLPFKRDLSFNPVFQTGFTFEPPMELDLHNLEITPEKIHNQGTQLDLFFTLWETNEEIQGFIEFNTELFKASTIKRLIGNYETLLQEIITLPEIRINSLNILTDQEKHQQLIQWNATQVCLPDNPLLHKLFEEQTKKTPESIAYVSEGSQLTYQQLNVRANQLAHHLNHLGIDPGSRVGIFMDRSLDMIVALYAILKAGGAYVPLDPAFPEERIAYMMNDADLKLILTEEKSVHQLPDHDSQKIQVDKMGSVIKNAPESNLEKKISPKDSAYIIYTSGSTGKPKGVQVPHQAVVNFLQSMKQKPGITNKDTLLAVTTLSFDIAGLELFLPQTVGGKTIIASQKTAANGELLLELLQTSKATIMQATPITWHLLMAAGWKGSKDFKILCGGEPLPRDMAFKLTQCASSVWNMYGPTETTIWSTCCQISDTDNQIVVGKPIENTQIYIVNKDDQPTPVGVAGELLIGGTGVTCGYLNRPDLTRKMFTPDFFKKDSSSHTLYRTGDMACYLADGSIKILGRMDNQIKLRGYRIELGEIEAVLENHPDVKQAASIVREDEPGDKRLIAYTVFGDKHQISDMELKQYLRSKLPEYMVPSTFIQMETMPLTLNGKIDRRALPQPEHKRISLEQILTPPETKIEKNLSKLWIQTLKIDKAGIHDNFFDLGGNSLLSIQLVTLLEETIGIHIPIAKFYQYPTIKSLAHYISSKEIKSNYKNIAQNRAQMQRKALAKKLITPKKVNKDD